MNRSTSDEDAAAALAKLLRAASLDEISSAVWWLGRYGSELDLAIEDGDYRPDMIFVDGDTVAKRSAELAKRRHALHLGAAALRKCIESVERNN